MIINGETREKLIENINDNFKNITSSYMNFIHNLENVETVEELIQLKQSFLIDYLHNMPLRGNYCYFCLENYYYCVACPYAKHHNNCNHENSDWRSIDKTLIDLVDKINTEYYRGEKY